jgi:hypothetical protein
VSASTKQYGGRARAGRFDALHQRVRLAGPARRQRLGVDDGQAWVAGGQLGQMAPVAVERSSTT